MREIISRFCRFYLKHYIASAIIALLIFGVGLVFALQLEINSNQLDLLPQDLPQVKEANKITEMVGGTGFFIITLKSDKPDAGDRLILKARRLKIRGRDAAAEKLIAQANALYRKKRNDNIKSVEVLKKISDELYDELIKLKEIRFIQHKFKLDFLTKHALYRLETSDLREVFRRVGRKRDELIEKADPFYIDLESNPDYKLDLTDIIRKYSRIGKKEVLDDYYVSPDRRMMVLLIKPAFSMNEIDISKRFLSKVKGIIEKKNLAKRGVVAGYTGSYVYYVDAYDSVRKSLRPTTLLSLLGITIILFLFVRKKRLIGALLVSLIFAIVVTFGLTRLLIGELNIITSMLGGILAGLGIDFGIHFIFRFREEFSKTRDLYGSITEAIIRTGSAAVWSASTTAAAFVVLIVSDFRGFSEFGLIAGYGIFITAISMFFLTPLQIVIYYKMQPNFLEYLKRKPIVPEEEAERLARYNLGRIARVVLILSIILFIPGIYYARDIGFDHDSRNMLESDLTSQLLVQEMNIRYEIAGDPLAIATHTIEDTAAVWEYFEPLNEEQDEYISQVVGIHGFVPPMDQQLRNQKLIAKFRRKNAVIKRAMLPPAIRKHWKLYREVISAKPYTYYDMPHYIRDQFMNVKQSKIKGWLTFVYPNVERLYLAQDIRKLDRLIGRFEYPILGRRTIRYLANYIPQWERKTGRRIRGSKERKKIMGLWLSERERSGVLDIASRIRKKELAKMGFLPAVNEIILKERPFRSLKDLQKKKGTAITTGSTLLVAKFVKIVMTEAKFILIATAVLILGILYLSFRRLDYSAITLVPLVTGIILMLGIMAIFDVRVNFFNIAVLPIIVGYGINNGIFIFRRYLEVGELSSSVFRTGSAVIASSLTTLAGWGSLSIASHPGLRSMGYVACIGLTVMMGVSVLILPAILQLVSEKRVKLKK